MYIEGKPILHGVDKATPFQAARFLRSMNTLTVWEAVRSCWIDVYIGPPEVIVHDAGTNFTRNEFKQNAQLMAFVTKEVAVEAHHTIGKIERYHAPLRRAYETIRAEMSESSADVLLQTAVKAINDTAGPKNWIRLFLTSRPMHERQQHQHRRQTSNGEQMLSPR